MTDTIIQNSNINEIIDITKYQFTAKPETDGSFSALFTNASNKAEQTQSNFIDTAVKSNTSSINKYALDSKNTQTDSKNQDNTKNISKKTQSATTEGNTVSKNVENNQNVKPKKNQTASNFNDNKTVEQNKKADNTAFNSQKPVSTTKEGISVNKADTRSQNIDNNSLESSPVSLDNAASNNSDVQKIQSETIILNDEITAKNDIQQEIKEIVENILITYDIPINTNNDNSINID